MWCFCPSSLYSLPTVTCAANKCLRNSTAPSDRDSHPVIKSFVASTGKVHQSVAPRDQNVPYSADDRPLTPRAAAETTGLTPIPLRVSCRRTTIPRPIRMPPGCQVDCVEEPPLTAARNPRHRLQALPPHEWQSRPATQVDDGRSPGWLRAQLRTSRAPTAVEAAPPRPERNSAALSSR